MRYKSHGYQRLARLAHVGGDTENVSLLKHIIIPSLIVTGAGIPASTTILSVTNSGEFELSANATATAASASLTFTNASGSAFTHICSTADTDATVTHFPRYDSIQNQYTKKHFRFFRENSIGARRRTYVGTQNTEATSVDFGLPFETMDDNVNTNTVGTTTPPINPVRSAGQPPGGTTPKTQI